MSSSDSKPRKLGTVGRNSYSRNLHEGIPLIFDLSIKGFYRWCRRRVKYLGYYPFITPYKYDHQIMIYAQLINGYIVTTDKYFLKCKRAIVLHIDKYEKMYTEMLKDLHDKKHAF